MSWHRNPNPREDCDCDLLLDPHPMNRDHFRCCRAAHPDRPEVVCEIIKGPMPSLTMPVGRPWPPPGLQLWSLDYACGCVRFRRGDPVFLPCRRHEAHLGRWSA